MITHNLSAFLNIPKHIPYKGHLTVTEEGLIHKSVFERLKDTLIGSNGETYRNARNLASGSIRCLDGATCLEREVSFYAFHVLEGLEGFPELTDSRSKKRLALSSYGFQVCPFELIAHSITADELEEQINAMVTLADLSDLSIDGMVLRFKNLSYSSSLGRTGHHYHDGLAYKFEDETYETIFRSIEWQTSRSGEIAPVALFDTVKIDGCEVSQASLHNLSFIKDLELYSGCRILVSKRNMIIPHVEENLDRYRDEIIPLDGFGEKSHERMWASIQESRNTSFVRFVVAMDSPGIGRTRSY